MNGERNTQGNPLLERTRAFALRILRLLRDIPEPQQRSNDVLYLCLGLAICAIRPELGSTDGKAGALMEFDNEEFGKQILWWSVRTSRAGAEKSNSRRSPQP